jgi:DNA replication protein DnaC
VKDLIEYYCKQLRWGRSIVNNYPKIQAENNEEFLAKLLKMELDYRETARKNRMLKKANFDVLKTFEGYTFESIQMPSNITIEDIKKGEFIDNKENLILYGAVGTGKTHLATAIGVEACNNGRKVKFYRTAALVNQLIEAKASGELNKLLKQLQKIDLLICDEWGYIPLDREGSQLLFEVIGDCYEKRSIIITTNLEFSKWVNIFYDERMTNALIDRLIHHSYLLMFSGDSYRLKHSTIKS